jgi:hypothetical protein
VALDEALRGARGFDIVADRYAAFSFGTRHSQEL